MWIKRKDLFPLSVFLLIFALAYVLVFIGHVFTTLIFGPQKIFSYFRTKQKPLA